MSQLSPVQIRALRERLGWSARQLGAFLDRSHQTIYNWESGATEPDGCVNAILHALKTELDRRAHSQHGSAVSDWIDQLEDEGLILLLHPLMKKGLESFDARLEGCMDEPVVKNSESSSTHVLRPTT